MVSSICTTDKKGFGPRAVESVNSFSAALFCCLESGLEGLLTNYDDSDMMVLL